MTGNAPFQKRLLANIQAPMNIAENEGLRAMYTLGVVALIIGVTMRVQGCEHTLGGGGYLTSGGGGYLTCESSRCLQYKRANKGLRTSECDVCVPKRSRHANTGHRTGLTFSRICIISSNTDAHVTSVTQESSRHPRKCITQSGNAHVWRKTAAL